MIGRFKQTKISDISDVQQRGLHCSLRRLVNLGQKFLFESPCAISNTVFKGECSVGYLSYLRPDCTVSHADIGRYCSIAPDTFIGGGEHPTDWLSSHSFQYGGGDIFTSDPQFTNLIGKKKFAQPKGRSQIGNDVWIGQGANISRGVQIGDGAIVAARAVVTKDVAPYTIVAGVPAKPLRKRFDDAIISRLTSLKWWKYDLTPVAAKIDYSNIEKALNLIEQGIKEQRILPLRPLCHTLLLRDNEYILK